MRDRLAAARVARLATVSADGRPHVILTGSREARLERAVRLAEALAASAGSDRAPRFVDLCKPGDANSRACGGS